MGDFINLDNVSQLNQAGWLICNGSVLTQEDPIWGGEETGYFLKMCRILNTPGSQCQDSGYLTLPDFASCSPYIIEDVKDQNKIYPSFDPQSTYTTAPIPLMAHYHTYIVGNYSQYNNICTGASHNVAQDISTADVSTLGINYESPTEKSYSSYTENVAVPLYVLNYIILCNPTPTSGSLTRYPTQIVPIPNPLSLLYFIGSDDLGSFELLQTNNQSDYAKFNDRSIFHS